ncbi:hypothetical protein [Fluviicola sp.]|uniref:hypothetical protein n=1 Tax=Fluviicola sp. TaxID=1917219 RepID=UPI0031DD7FC1
MKHLFFWAIMLCFSSAFGQANIVLISLDDKDTIDYRYPVFNWYYVSAPDGRDNVKYNYVLTELHTNQSALTGVTVNQPLLRINGVQGFQLVYPFDAPELQYGKRYGWQLEKTVNNIIVEKSEAWEFTLYKEVVIPMKYVYLNSDYNATIYQVEGDGFYFKMNSRYKSSGNLKCRVLNENAEDMEVQLGEDQKIGANDEPEKSGREFHYLRTDVYPAGIYTLIVKDPKGNEYNTRFRIN